MCTCCCPSSRLNPYNCSKEYTIVLPYVYKYTLEGVEVLHCKEVHCFQQDSFQRARILQVLNAANLPSWVIEPKTLEISELEGLDWESDAIANAEELRGSQRTLGNACLILCTILPISHLLAFSKAQCRRRKPDVYPTML